MKKECLEKVLVPNNNLELGLAVEVMMIIDEDTIEIDGEKYQFNQLDTEQKIEIIDELSMLLIAQKKLRFSETELKKHLLKVQKMTITLCKAFDNVIGAALKTECAGIERGMLINKGCIFVYGPVSVIDYKQVHETHKIKSILQVATKNIRTRNGRNNKTIGDLIVIPAVRGDDLQSRKQGYSCNGCHYFNVCSYVPQKDIELEKSTEYTIMTDHQKEAVRNRFEMTLTERQAEFVNANPKALLCDSVGGAGKTFVLVQKILGLEHDSLLKTYDPSDIMLITFTNAGADEMRSRITSYAIATEQSVEGMQIKTFDALALDLLSENYFSYGYSEPPILEVNEESVLHDFVIHQNLNKNWLLETSDVLLDQLFSHDERVAYENYRERYGKMTFVDSVSTLIKGVMLGLLNPKVLIIDEFQDTSSDEMTVLAALFETALEKLIVLGDSTQGIYEFRGAISEPFTKLKEILPESIKSDLIEVNFTKSNRLPNVIADLSNFVTLTDTRDPNSRIIPGFNKVEGNGQYGFWEETQGNVIDAIKQVKKYSYIDQTGKYVTDLPKVTFEVRETKTKYVLDLNYDTEAPIGGFYIYNDNQVLETGLVETVSLNKSDVTNLNNVSVEAIIDLESDNIELFHEDKSATTAVLFRTNIDLILSSMMLKKQGIKHRVNNFRSYGEYPGYVIAKEMIELIMLGHINKFRALATDLDIAIKPNILDTVKGFINNPNDALLKRIAWRFKNINDVNEFYNILLDLASETITIMPTPGEIVLTTVHKSKGLEFDNVIIDKANVYKIPGFMFDPEEKLKSTPAYIRLVNSLATTNNVELVHERINEMRTRALAPYNHLTKDLEISKKQMFVAITRSKRNVILIDSPSFY